jgi:hypothetical protein
VSHLQVLLTGTFENYVVKYREAEHFLATAQGVLVKAPETRQIAPLRGIPAPGYATETRATLEAPEGCPRVAYLRERETGGRGVIGTSDPKRPGRVLP